MTITRVSPSEALSLVQDQGYVYVDVRSMPEFEQGHPTGAYNVPLLHMTAGGMQPNPDFVTVMQANFPTSTKIVLGCRSGGRSLNAATQLEKIGYTNLIDQKAGFSGAADAFGRQLEAGWQSAGLPVATTPEAGRGYHDLATKAHRG